MEFNLAQVHEAVAASAPDRPSIIQGERSSTYGELTDRTRRLANHLLANGLGAHRERGDLPHHEPEPHDERPPHDRPQAPPARPRAQT